MSPNAIGDANFLVAAKFCANKQHEYQTEMLQNYLHNVWDRFEEDKKDDKATGERRRKNSREETAAAGAAAAATTTTTKIELSTSQQQQKQPQQQQSTFTSDDEVGKPCSRLDPLPPQTLPSASAKPPFNSSSSSSSNRHPCISAGCNSYGSPVSSYLCNACFAKHKEEWEKDIQQRGSNLPPNSPVKRQPASSSSSAAATLPKRAGSSSNLLTAAVKGGYNNAAAAASPSAFSSLPRRK